jgi:hypothetical protein
MENTLYRGLVSQPDRHGIGLPTAYGADGYPIYGPLGYQDPNHVEQRGDRLPVGNRNDAPSG